MLLIYFATAHVCVVATLLRVQVTGDRGRITGEVVVLIVVLIIVVVRCAVREGTRVNNMPIHRRHFGIVIIIIPLLIDATPTK